MGAYAPFHKGHAYVIDTMMEECDEVYILIYEAQERIHVPLDKRSAWITDYIMMTHMYKDKIGKWDWDNVHVISAVGGPTDIGYTPEIIAKHDEYILSQVGDKGITHFYSSELYGEHVSIALDCVNRLVDLSRVAYPISGTKLRNDPRGVGEDLCFPWVMTECVVNVCMLGGESTGKSTLTKALAKEFNALMCPEYGAMYWEQHVDGKLTVEDMEKIVYGHDSMEYDIRKQSDRIMFTDTCFLTTQLFTRVYHGAEAAENGVFFMCRNEPEEYIERYDLFVLCDTDIPYDDTPDRMGPAMRDVFNEVYKLILDDKKLPYIVVRGSVDERVAMVKQELLRRKLWRPMKAYLPPHLENSSEVAGYREIAQSFLDKGEKIVWLADGPNIKSPDGSLVNVSSSFMYPTIFAPRETV